MVALHIQRQSGLLHDEREQIWSFSARIAKAGEVIFEPLRRHLRDFAVLPYVTELEVRPAVLANAGLLGAAALALSLPR